MNKKIRIENLRRFEGNPFEIREDDAFNELVDSIREKGIIVPIIVIPAEEENAFEVISGSRRVEAARRLGIDSVPVDVQKLSRDEAIITLVDCNISQRDLLPSEKAFAYKLKHDALKHQGKSENILQNTSGQIVPKPDSRRTAAIIGEENGDSYKTVQRLIRLTELKPELLKLVDEGRIAMSPAVEISFLEPEFQDEIYSAYEDNEATPSYSQAVRIHQAAKNDELTCDIIREIMDEEKANQVNKLKIAYNKLPRGDKLFPYVGPGKRFSSLEDFMLKAAEYYLQHLERMRNRDAR